MARHGKARPGKARQGKARLGRARLGEDLYFRKVYEVNEDEM